MTQFIVSEKTISLIQFFKLLKYKVKLEPSGNDVAKLCKLCLISWLKYASISRGDVTQIQAPCVGDLH